MFVGKNVKKMDIFGTMSVNASPAIIDLHLLINASPSPRVDTMKNLWTTNACVKMDMAATTRMSVKDVQPMKLWLIKNACANHGMSVSMEYASMKSNVEIMKKT